MENRLTSVEAAGVEAATGRLAHARHLIRLAALLVAALVAGVVVKSLLVPATFGEYGHYRGAALHELASLPMAHLGSDACGTCHEHEAQLAKHAAGSHKGVACESCHGAARGHEVAGAGRRHELTVDRSAKACLMCHGAVQGRPAAFPQVELRKHLSEMSGEDVPADMKALGEVECTSCHDAHDGSV